MVNLRYYISHSEQETRDIAKKTAADLKPGDVILFTGEMGAGKTAFTKGLAEYFGSEEEVSSPTFALVNEYPGRVPIFHFDLYRIYGFDDLYAVGFFDYLDRDGIIVVEWSENVPELKNELKHEFENKAENVIKVDIRKRSDNEREIYVSRVGL